MPIDYSKFDNLDTDSEGDEPAAAGKGGGAYTDEQRKQFEEAAARAQQAQAPTAGDDPRGEIERLKAERRAKREAEAVKEASSGAPPPPSDAAADDDVTAEVAGEEEGPLSQLTAAERLADNIRADIASVEASLANLTDYDASLMQTCVKINGGVGKLQNDLDGIAIGSLEEGEARDAAKARRKMLNVAVEEELMPGGNAIRAKVVKAKNAAGM